VCKTYLIILMGSVSWLEKVAKGIVVGAIFIKCKMMIL
jgi:hypothetical protein